MERCGGIGTVLAEGEDMKTTNKANSKRVEMMVAGHVEAVAKRLMGEGYKPLDGRAVELALTSEDVEGLERAMGYGAMPLDLARFRDGVRLEIDLHGVG